MTDTNSAENQSAETYTATLAGTEGSETVELTLINGQPQKSFVRPTAGEGVDDTSEEIVWELDRKAEGFVYRQAGVPGADYS